MANKKVLIVTHTNDNACVAQVSRYIEEAGGEAIRFDVDLYPTATYMTTVYKNGTWEVTLENKKRYVLNDLAGIWYRRSHHVGEGIENILSAEYLSAAKGEIRRTLYGMIESLSCFQMERYSTYRRLDSKEEQLRIAERCGLQIPSTCITNSPMRIREFMNEIGGTVIAKMQSSFSIVQEGNEQVVFTNEITSTDLISLDSLSYCPMLFQQKLEKKLELRITIVGDKLFAFCIDSQKEANARIDWRKEGLRLMDDWKPYQLPRPIEDKLIAFMDSYQINYGAIDLILTPDDEYYFLEINPAGEYFWLDKLCNFEISKQIAAVLLGHAKRR